MLDEIRYALAAALFCLGIYFCADLALSGFELIVVVGAVVCLVLAHFVKPTGTRRTKTSFLDVLDLIIDIPFRAIALALRAASKPFRDFDGIDL